MIRNAWHHGGPTSSFIHLVSSFCFLLPRIIIEAKLIEVGFLSRGETAPADDSFTLTHLLIADTIWTTDLDWLAPNNDRFVVQSFFTSSAGSGNPLLQEVSFSSHQILSNIFPIQTSSVPQQQQQTKLNKCINECPDILCSQLYNQLSLNNSHNPEFAHSAPHSPTPNIVYQQSININSRVMVVDTNGNW